MIAKPSDESAFTQRCRKWRMGMVRCSLCYQFCSWDKKEAAGWVGGRAFIFELSPYLTRKQCEQCTSPQALSDTILRAYDAARYCIITGVSRCFNLKGFFFLKSSLLSAWSLADLHGDLKWNGFNKNISCSEINPIQAFKNHKSDQV